MKRQSPNASSKGVTSVSRLLVKPAKSRQRHDITPENAGWLYVGFALHELQAGEDISLQQSGRELCLVILTGSANVQVGDQNWNDVGGRQTVFEDKAPGAIYVPAGHSAQVTASTDIELAVCSAPGDGSIGSARQIAAEKMSQEVRGKNSNTRYVRNILPETESAELSALGYQLNIPQNAHLCCGSAGTYSLLQPQLSKQLRDNKLTALQQCSPEVIITANVGCEHHLNSAGKLPVIHWVELVANDIEQSC